MESGILKLEKSRFKRDTKAVLKHLKGCPMLEGSATLCIYSSGRGESSSIFWEAHLLSELCQGCLMKE